MCIYNFNYEVDGNQIKGELDLSSEGANIKVEYVSNPISLTTLKQFIDQVEVWGEVRLSHRQPEGGGIKKILIKEKEE